jgi:putative membrane protein
MNDLSLAHQQSEKWQRLSPASIIYFALKSVSLMVKNGIQALVPIGAAIAAFSDFRWTAFVLVVICGAALMLAFAVLSYFKFRFRIEKSAFLIRSGVFNRKRLTLSFNRIQNVALKEPIYFRPFNIIVLILESAGSSDEEVSLAGIPRPLAEAIRRQILAVKTDESGITERQNDEALDEINTQKTSEPLLQLPISELVRYGLSSSSIWVFAGIFAGFISQLDPLWNSGLVDKLFNYYGDIVGVGVIALVLGSTLLVFLFLLLIATASILGSIIVNYQYTLSYADGRYHRTRGLFERQETSIPTPKIQSLTLSQPIIARLFERFHIVVGQVGFKGKNNNKAQRQKFIIPSATAKFNEMLVKHIYPASSILSEPLKPIHKAFIKRRFLYSLSLPLLVTTISTGVNFGWWSITPLLVPFTALPFIFLQWRWYGFATDGDHGLVRTGLLGHRMTLFPFYKVQTVEVTQSPGQRRDKHATLKIKLAGQSVTIPYIDKSTADEWREIILMKVETSKNAWM